MKLTVDILDDFINSMVLNGGVISFSDNGTNTTLVVEKTYHARKRMIIDVDGNAYEVTAVVNNQSIEVKGVLTSADQYTVPIPKYFHGTPIMTNTNHISGAKSKDKVPMVYLYEIFEERVKDVFSSISKESDLRLFFLDSANFSEWTTDEHYSNRLLGLTNLVNEFIEQSVKYKCFYLHKTEFKIKNHVNWGSWKDNQGIKRRVFDDDLTGIELSFTLPIQKCCN